MTEDLDRRVHDARDAVNAKASLESRRATIATQIADCRSRLERLDTMLRHEEDDVRRLEGLTIAAMFAALGGRKDERLTKERADVVRAKLSRDAAADALEALEKDRDTLDAQIGALGDVASAMGVVLAEKEARAHELGAPLATWLDSIDAAAASARARFKEVTEAVAAAEAAISELHQVSNSLGGAATVGQFDMLGGGMMTTMAKHGKIDEARQRAQSAQRALDRLAREMSDVEHGDRPLLVDIGEFATFADYWLDGLFADWATQNKIHASRQRVVSTARSVGDVRARLVALDLEIRKELVLLDAERRSVVESG